MFAEMATLPKLISLEVIACSKVTGKGVHALKACAKVIDYRVSTSNGIG